MPGSTFARLVAFDGLIHGWDLATSTQQEWDPPEDVVAEVDAFARQAIAPEMRDGTFAQPPSHPSMQHHCYDSSPSAGGRSSDAHRCGGTMNAGLASRMIGLKHHDAQPAGVLRGVDAADLPGEAPEWAGQFEAIENLLVLITGVRVPVGVESITPPGMRHFAQLRHRDRRSCDTPAKPAFDVFLRPEEVHRCSSEDNVVPPTRRWEQAMEQHARVVRLLVVYIDGNGFAAVRA